MKKLFALVFILSLISTFLAKAQFKDGDLIKGKDDKVYIVVDKKVCWIPDIDIFNAMGLDWNSVKQIDDAKLKKMTKGDLVFRDKGGRYYKHYNGRAAFLGDEKSYKLMGMNEKFVRDLPEAELKKLPLTATIIKGKGKTKYLLISGKICQLPSDKTFKNLGFDPANVNTISDKGLAGMPKAPLLIKGFGEKVYVIEKDKKRWIPSEDIFKKNNYDWNTVYNVDDKVLSAFPDGTPIK